MFFADLALGNAIGKAKFKVPGYRAVLINRFQTFSIEILRVKAPNLAASNKSLQTCWAALSCALETSKSTTEQLAEIFCRLSTFFRRHRRKPCESMNNE